MEKTYPGSYVEVHSLDELWSLIKNIQVRDINITVKAIDCLGDAPEVYRLLMMVRKERNWNTVDRDKLKGLAILYDETEVIRDLLRRLQDGAKFKEHLLDLRTSALKVRRLAKNAEAGDKVSRMGARLGNRLLRFVRKVLSGKKFSYWMRCWLRDVESDVEDVAWLCSVSSVLSTESSTYSLRDRG